MNPQNWLGRAYAKAVSLFPRSYNYISYVFSRATQRRTDFQSLLDRNEGWVAPCVRLNADNVAKANLRLYVRGGTTRFATQGTGDVVELVQHPYLDLMKARHHGLSWQEMIWTTVSQLELVGNSYWYLDFNNLGIPQDITILSPQYITLKTDPLRGITAYSYRTGGETQDLDPANVIHFKYMDPSNPYGLGLGKLQQAVDAADRLDSIDDYMLALFDNQARPDLLLHLPAGATKEQGEQVLEAWNTRFQGTTNAWKAGILPGDIDVKEVSMKPVDTGLFDSFKLGREEIFACFGVKPQFFSISQAKAELAASDPIYMAMTIEPILSLIEGVINHRLISLYDPTGRLFVQYDNVVPEDDKAEADRVIGLVRAGIYTANEARAELGKDPADGGGELRVSVTGSFQDPPQENTSNTGGQS